METRNSYPATAMDIHGRPVRMLMGSVPVGKDAKPAAVHPAAVIVPTVGRADICGCLRAIAESAKSNQVPMEVIVVNSSGRPIAAEGARVVSVEPGAGFAKACNTGAAATRAKRLVFLNDDCLVEGDWLDRMVRAGSRLASAIVGCLLRYPASDRVQHAGMLPDGSGLFVHEPKLVRASEVAEDGHRLAVSGACMLVERYAWDRLEGFSESFGRGYFEDVDLCLRWIEAGGLVGYCGTATVYHKESATFGAEPAGQRAAIGAGAEEFRRRWPWERQRAVIRRGIGLSGVPSVDIVVSVFNACRYAVDCIMAVRGRTPRWIPWRLVVVDDGSDEFTSRQLDEMREEGAIDELVHQANSGYLPAVDMATRASRADVVVYLNSDVMVTDGWLAKLLRPMMEDPRVKMTNPYTNAAAHLSVSPPPGSNYADMNERMELASEHRWFEVVTPVGFCMPVDRRAIAECGGWDVRYYGRGYGEECDLYMRMLQAGYRSAMADDCFVMHEGGKTFGQTENKQALEHAGYVRFMDRWKKQAGPLLDDYAKRRPHHYVLRPAESVRSGRRRVVFVFQDLGLYGGVLAVVNICNRLVELGWNASFACLRVADWDKIGSAVVPYRYAGKDALVAGLRSELRDADVVATVWPTAMMVRDICAGRPDLRPAYFIQDVEWLFMFPNGRPMSERGDVEGSYRAIRRKVANSDWVLETVAHSCGDRPHKIGIGVDPVKFYPLPRRNKRPVVMAHCRPATSRRGWEFIAEVFREADRRLRGSADFVVYDQAPVGAPARTRSLGQMSHDALAREMRKADIFFEGSRYQGWGMQALESMASGCALVSTANLGVDNYATNGHDCVLMAHGDVGGAADIVVRLAGNRVERERLGENARRTAERFSWDAVASEWSRWLGEGRTS